MNEIELITTGVVVGVSIPMVLYFVYWIAVDQAKRYTDKKVREVSR